MSKQLLHLVFGGKVKDPGGLEFISTEDLDLVGIFPDYKTAVEAWRSASQSSVDDAMMKYVVVHLHRMLEPELLHTPASDAPNRQTASSR